MKRHERDTVILDLDGTLVDSVYVHVMAWRAAFRDVGLDVPAARLHRLIGMGGDRLVAHAAGRAVEDAMGDELRSRHPVHLDVLFGLITPTEGADELLTTLNAHRFNVVLASSSDAGLTDRLLGLVPGAHRVLDAVVTGSDAEESKPSGELLEIAVRRVDADRAVVVGDATWDVKAAKDAGVPAVGLLTGGISEHELLGAGAVTCLANPGALAAQVSRSGGRLEVDG